MQLGRTSSVVLGPMRKGLVLAHGTAGGVPYFYNLKASNTTKWRAGLARVNANTGPARILCIGESTTAGSGAGDASNYIKARPRAYPVKIADELALRGIRATADTLCSASGHNAANLVTYDERFANPLASGWTVAGQSLGGNQFRNSTTATPLNFSIANNVDTIRVLGIKGSTFGTGTLAVDGGAALGTFGLNQPTSAIEWLSVNVSLGPHTLNFVRTASASQIAAFMAIEAWNSAAPPVLCYLAGASGWVMADQTVSTFAYSQINAIPVIAPDLVFLNDMINDAVAPTDPTAYKASAQIVIDAARATADVIMVIPHRVSTASASEANQAALSAAVFEVAAANDLPVLDLRYVFGADYAAANAAGWMYDTLHPKAAGYAKWAQLAVAGLA